MDLQKSALLCLASRAAVVLPALFAFKLPAHTAIVSLDDFLNIEVCMYVHTQPFEISLRPSPPNRVLRLALSRQPANQADYGIRCLLEREHSAE